MSKTVYDRTRMLLGKEALSRIRDSRVLLFGVGGVGGFVAEALARAGVGTLYLVDFDRVDLTNINRQIIALHSTLDREKAVVMAERIKDINPEIRVEAMVERVCEETADHYPFDACDYVVDAVDDVPAKLLIIQRSKAAGTPVISSMGTGNKLDPGQFRIADIRKTHTCPLARSMRKRLEKLEIRDVKVLFSTEPPTRAEAAEEERSPASVSFVPASAGLLIAGEVIRDLIKAEKKQSFF